MTRADPPTRQKPGRSTHSRALRVGFWWSARLVKGAARVWVCLRRGAAVLGSARASKERRGAEGCNPPASSWRVCTASRCLRAAAPALGTLAPGGGGLDAAGSGLDALWAGFAGRGNWQLSPLASELPYPDRRAPRRLQAVCCKVRRVPGVACGSARLLRGRRGVKRRGAEGCKPPASVWRVCTGSRGVRAAALALGTLAPSGAGLGAAGSGLDAPWEGFARRRGAGAAFVSEIALS